MNNWKKRYNSLKEAVSILDKRLKETSRQNSILQAEKKQWAQQQVVQENVITQQLGNSDKVVRQLQDEIMMLRKKLKDGDLD